MKIAELSIIISFLCINSLYSAAASTKIKTVYVSQTTTTRLNGASHTEQKTDSAIAQLEQASIKIEHDILYNILYSKFFLGSKQIGAWRWHIIEEHDVACCCIKVGPVRRYGVVTIKWAISGYENLLDKKVKEFFKTEYKLDDIRKALTCKVIAT